MTFPVDVGVPLASHKPVNDVTPMRTNFSNLVSTWAVDHYSPNESPVGSSSGTHKQITYPQKNVPGAPLGDIMVDYTNSGTANPAAPQRFTRNSQGIFPMSAVRAFGSFVLTPGLITFINSFNTTAASNVALVASTLVATVNLTANAVNGTSFVVIPFLNTTALGTSPAKIIYSVAANTITFTVENTSSTFTLSFIALQV